LPERISSLFSFVKTSGSRGGEDGGEDISSYSYGELGLVKKGLVVQLMLNLCCSLRHFHGLVDRV